MSKDKVIKKVGDLQKQIDTINETGIGKENIPSIQKVIDHIKKKNPKIYPPIKVEPPVEPPKITKTINSAWTISTRSAENKVISRLNPCG